MLRRPITAVRKVFVFAPEYFADAAGAEPGADNWIPDDGRPAIEEDVTP